MTDIGYFTIDTESRSARGYLLPWGVKSKGRSSSNTAPISFPKDSVRIPRDPMVVSLNDEHQRHEVLGRALSLQSDDIGIFAEFGFADTDEAEEWMEAHKGAPVYFSAEVKSMTRAPGDVGGGVLAGAAVTATPAFDGTVAMFSMLGDETAVGPDDDEEDNPDIVRGDDEATAEVEEEPDEEPDATEGGAVAEAIAPTGQFSRKPVAAPALTKAGFFSAMRQYRQTADTEALKPYMEGMVSATEGDPGMFALTDIAYDGASGLAAVSKQPNTWLGELWQGRRFNRTVVPLLSQGTLNGIAMDAWVWTTKPAMATWAGNKANVPSNTPVVAPKQFFAQRFAGGHDLAREYFDFNQTDIIDSYVQAMVDSYASLSDGYALTTLVAGATAFTPGAATANKGLMGVIDGALAVVAAQAVPSFAVVAPNVFRDILGTSHSDALEYFDSVVNLTEASGPGFTIVPDARLTAGQVVVGAREAATAWELPGSPIRVSLPDLVKGGIDQAFFGYIGVGVTYPAGVVKATITLT